jgi:hypothetical protein
MKELFHMRVEQEDLKNWKAAAEGDGVSLSAWIRKRCEPLVPAPQESLLTLTLRGIERQNKRTCPHGKPKGWNCGLCGGLAKIE